MPKNKGKGGKKYRKGKNEAETEKRELVFKEDGQEYAQVTKMLGNGRLEAMSFDGTKRLCRIRGKLRKKVWINQGDIILIGLRDYHDAKADVILRYTPYEARNLKKYGEFPEAVCINDTVTFVEDGSDEDRKGGKKYRKGKNEAETEKRELVFKKDGQEYAQVTKMRENGRLEAMSFDGTKRLCRIRGKLRKKVWINQGDIILIGLRDYHDAKADVILRYTPYEARNLKKYGEFPEAVCINDTVTFVEDGSDEDRKGGKKYRKGKNEAETEKRELVFKKDGQEYAQVTKMLENGRLEAMSFDGTKRLCRIRGKLRKKVWINQGDIILIGLRDYHDAKADVILRYTPYEARNLKKYGEFPEAVCINDTVTFVKDGSDEDSEFGDDISSSEEADPVDGI